MNGELTPKQEDALLRAQQWEQDCEARLERKYADKIDSLVKALKDSIETVDDFAGEPENHASDCAYWDDKECNCRLLYARKVLKEYS